MKNWLTETYNLLFRPRKTIASARNMFYSDYAAHIRTFREQGEQNAAEWLDEKVPEMEISEVIKEHDASLSDKEYFERSERRLVNTLVYMGLWNVLMDNLAVLALIATLVLTFGFGFHPLIMLVPVGMILVGFLPYVTVALICNTRLMETYFQLGWDDYALEYFRQFWEQNPFCEENTAETTDAEATSSP